MILTAVVGLAAVSLSAAGQTAYDRSEDAVAFVRQLEESGMTVGTYADHVLRKSDPSWITAHEGVWEDCRQALDMSEWIRAAETFEAIGADKTFADKNIAGLFRTLRRTKEALALFVKDSDENAALMYRLRPEVKKEFRGTLIGWDNGRAPRITVPAALEAKLKSQGHEKLSAARRFLDGVQGFYGDLDRVNNLNQQPARTPYGTPVWVGQEHHWAYLAWKKAQDAGLLPASAPGRRADPAKKTVLVHWDAHRDMSAPRKIPEKPGLSAWLDKVHSGDLTVEAAAQAASEMGVSSFIVPALYEGLIDEVILVFPDKAGAPYWPASGEARAMITVGLCEDGKRMGYWSDDRIMQNCVSGFCRKDDWVACRPAHTRDIPVRFVRPAVLAGDPDRYIGADDAVILDFDEDYLGTYNVREVGGLPDFWLTIMEYQRALKPLADFYEKVHGRVKVISIAASPNFVRGYFRRKHTGSVFRALHMWDGLPRWAEYERKRLPR